MRFPLLSAMTVLALGLGSAAMAADAMTATGAIKTIDAKAHTVTLADGTSYTLPSNFKMKKLTVGEKVSISWQANGGVNEVQKISAVKG